MLLLGLIKYGSRELAWDLELYGNIFIMNKITKNRFEIILRNFHWMNTFGVTQQQRNEKNKEQPYWTIL